MNNNCLNYIFLLFLSILLSLSVQAKEMDHHLYILLDSSKSNSIFYDDFLKKGVNYILKKMEKLPLGKSQVTIASFGDYDHSRTKSIAMSERVTFKNNSGVIAQKLGLILKKIREDEKYHAQLTDIIGNLEQISQDIKQNKDDNVTVILWTDGLDNQVSNIQNLMNLNKEISIPSYEIDFSNVEVIMLFGGFQLNPVQRDRLKHAWSNFFTSSKSKKFLFLSRVFGINLNFKSGLVYSRR